MLNALPVSDQQALTDTQFLEKRLHQRGFSQPNLAGHKHYLACASQGSLDALVESGQLGLASHRLQRLCSRDRMG